MKTLQDSYVEIRFHTVECLGLRLKQEEDLLYVSVKQMLLISSTEIWQYILSELLGNAKPA